jgi:hypothetical protein
VPDEQAAYEKSIMGYSMVMAGADINSGPGLLENYTILSYEQVLIDHEIYTMMLETLKGIDVSDETIAMEVTKRVGHEGHFLGQKHTVQHFKELWMPALSDPRPFQAWAKDGSKTVVKTASEKVSEILATHRPDPLPGSTQDEFARIIKEETARLNSIVAEFLKFARPPKPSVEPASLNDLIGSTLTLLHKEAEHSGVEIRRNLDPHLPEVKLDRDQIRQVLLNIVLNGIQAMPNGGILEVRSLLGEGGGVGVEVIDNGPGLDEKDLDHVFDPFYTTKPQGTGLGLSISYQLIQNHGGKIAACRNPEGGMIFRFEIPLAPPL